MARGAHRGIGLVAYRETRALTVIPNDVTIFLTPGGSCSTSCTNRFLISSAIALSPGTADGTTDWTGCSRMSDADCIVDLNDDTTVTVTRTPPPP